MDSWQTGISSTLALSIAYSHERTFHNMLVDSRMISGRKSLNLLVLETKDVELI